MFSVLRPWSIRSASISCGSIAEPLDEAELDSCHGLSLTRVVEQLFPFGQSLPGVYSIGWNFAEKWRRNGGS